MEQTVMPQDPPEQELTPPEHETEVQVRSGLFVPLSKLDDWADFARDMD